MTSANIIKRIFALFGQESNRAHELGSAIWSLHKYVDELGRFDYEKYRSAQIAANKRKLDRVWVQRENIVFLADYIQKHLSRVDFGLCHGTRRGLEQKWFKELLGCEVIGTEISDTANMFPDTIQWDFHDVKDEWKSRVDFIYSNSLDHSYDPEKCLSAWTSCLTKDGMLILEHSTDDVEARESDPFGAQLCILPYLVLLWSNGSYSVRELLPAPKRSQSGVSGYETYFLIVKKN